MVRGWSRRGGCRACQVASHTANSSSRPSEPAGLVSCAWRAAAAVPASRSGPGSWASSARISSRFAVGSGIGALLRARSSLKRGRNPSGKAPRHRSFRLAARFGYGRSDERSRALHPLPAGVCRRLRRSGRVSDPGARRSARPRALGGSPMRPGPFRWSAPVSARSPLSRLLAAELLGLGDGPAALLAVLAGVLRDRSVARGRSRRQRRRDFRRRRPADRGWRSCATAGTAPLASWRSC